MSTGHGEKLTRKQEAAIAALLTCGTIAAAAEQCGVSERTLRTWLQQAAFSTAFRQARGRLVDDALLSLQRAAGKAVATLDRNMDCGKQAVEVKAAATVLDRLLKLGDLERLAEEVAELKRLIEAKQ